jgi:putative ABC transport system permease protein
MTGRQFLDAWWMALAGASANKARTALTMLGVIFGVAAVIATIATGTGAQQAVTARISSLGTNLLEVQPTGGFFGGVRQAAGTTSTLTFSDAQQIAAQATPTGAAPDVAAVTPEYTSQVQVVDGAENASTTADGVEPNYLSALNWQVAYGSFISQQDVARDAKVADLGSAVLTDLFPNLSTVDPSTLIGSTIELNGEPYQIIGIMAQKGSAGGTNQDDRIFVPITTAEDRLAARSGGANTVTAIDVIASSQNSMNAAETEVGSLLMRLHHLTSAQQADFNILNQTSLLQTASSVTDVFTILLAAIAAVSLLVGGIGIMNIMLVTVTERTREIGLRKAVGARRRDILLQFMLEAVMVSGIGGLLGVAAGYGVAGLLPIITASTSSPLTTVVTGSSVLLALAVSVAIGFFFGSYPASRAAALDPIEALRYE